jgi:hypothetical protein
MYTLSGEMIYSTIIDFQDQVVVPMLGDCVYEYDIREIANEMADWHNEINEKGQILCNHSGFVEKDLNDGEVEEILERHYLANIESNEDIVELAEHFGLEAIIVEKGVIGKEYVKVTRQQGDEDDEETIAIGVEQDDEGKINGWSSTTYPHEDLNPEEGGSGDGSDDVKDILYLFVDFAGV